MIRIYPIDVSQVNVEIEREGESLVLQIHNSNGKETAGFHIIFPEDCKVERFSKGSIIIRKKISRKGK